MTSTRVDRVLAIVLFPLIAYAAFVRYLTGSREDRP